ncbi:DHA2 family efflux MFS transporter permease subunit [Nocardia camponoti]|nr:DHA2 family efflux MFS transporter permease subunit [Nocardia camponoti]
MRIALVLVIGMIMATLDQTIVNVAINKLSDEFNAGLATIAWVATGYSLALGAVVPSSAWLMGRFGAKRLYLGAVAGFVVGSVLVGSAWNVESLIAFRFIQGAAGGLLMPVATTILLRAASPETQGRLMSTLGLAILVGPLFGPVLGGYFIDEVSWRWMFFLNLPLGALVLVLVRRVVPDDQPEPTKPLDVVGLALMSPGLALVIYGVSAAGEGAGLAAVIGPVAVGVALIGAFVVRSLRVPAPLLDLRVLSNPTTRKATVLLALFATGYFGSMLLLPLYFQLVRGESAMVAGALGIPFALASGATMQVAGRLIDRVAPGRYLPFSIAVALTGFVAFVVEVNLGAPVWVLMLTMLAMGAGGGGTMMPVITTATRGLSRPQQPAGSTLLNMVSTSSMAIGTALTSVILSAQLPAGASLQALHAMDQVARANLAPALGSAFAHTYLLAPVLIGLALIPALLLPRKR